MPSLIRPFLQEFPDLRSIQNPETDLNQKGKKMKTRVFFCFLGGRLLGGGRAGAGAFETRNRYTTYSL